MRKKLFFTAIVSSIVASSLFASSVSSLQKDISKFLTNSRVKTKDIHILSSDKISDLKNLHVAIGTISNSPKPFIIIYNKNKLIVGNMIDRKNGKSIFKFFIDKHKKEIINALQKEKKNEKKIEISNNKKLVSLFKNQYKDLVLTIKGGNPKGKIVYLVTDPNCPFCKQYEKYQLPKTIKNSKEIKVIPVCLDIPGHETSPLRSSWLLEKGKKKNANILKMIYQASNPRNMDYKTVNKKFAKKMITKMKKLLNSGLIQGTPTVFDQNGNPMR